MNGNKFTIGGKMTIFILTIIFIISWLLVPIEYLLSFTNDDTYFYLKTALNFANLGKSTFDGINLTNGYHPFWFLLVSAIFKISLIAGVQSEVLLLRIVFIFISLINGIILIFIYRNFKELKIKNKAFILSISLLIPFVLFYQMGLEVQIFILFFLVMVNLVLKLFVRPDNRLLKIQLSIILSILFLCRVDLFWYVLIIVLSYVYLNKKDLLVHFIKLCVLPFFTFLIYVFLNKIIFDTYYPITSYYKLSFQIFENLKFFPTPLQNPIDFSILFLILFLTLISKYLITGNIYHGNDLFGLLRISNLVFIIFLVINFLINSNGVREWYYTFPMFTTILIFSITISEYKFYQFVFIVTLILNVFYFALFRINYYNHKSAFNYALELRKQLKNEAIIFQVDYSGLVSFFSGKKVINGDGLINSYEYYKYVKSGRLAEYLQKYKPDYISFYSFKNPFVYDKIIYKFKVIREYQILFDSSNLVLRELFFYGGIFRRKIGEFYLSKLNDYRIFVI